MQTPEWVNQRNVSEYQDAVTKILAALTEIEQLSTAAGKPPRFTVAQQAERIAKGEWGQTSALVDAAHRTMPQRLERARNGKF